MRHGELNTGVIHNLVREDRVSRGIYTEPAIFDLEMERIFNNSWVYVGHDTQVPNPGDYFSTVIGQQPVLLARHVDGNAYLLHNRCGHRGALVCNRSHGNTGRTFRCPYHGWTFKTNGELQAAPLKSGYPDRYDLKQPEFGLMPIRLSIYKGFLFANASGDAPEFHLPDGMKACIDAIIDRAPGHEFEVHPSGHRYLFHGNWKAQIDNLCDLYHPPYSHESTTSREGRQFKRTARAEGAQIMDGSDDGKAIWDRMEIYAFEGGHNFMTPLANETRDGPAFNEYRQILVDEHGEAKTAEILTDTYHNAFIFPNFNIQLLNQFIRVICPISASLTEIRVYPITYKSAPKAFNENVIRYVNVTHSPASFIQTDDLEMFRRIDVGLQNSKPDWVVLGRGFGESERVDIEGVKSFGTSEIAMRNHYQRWKELMA